MRLMSDGDITEVDHHGSIQSESDHYLLRLKLKGESNENESSLFYKQKKG